MTSYADPEVLIADWLHTQLDRKLWADPELPTGWSYNAPIGHVQRGSDPGSAALSLDVALLDIDWLANTADHAKQAASDTRNLMMFTLPLHTFPSGVFVKAVTCTAAPFWAFRQPPYKRSATYRVVLHGLVT